MYGGATAEGTICVIAPISAIPGGTWSVSSLIKQSVVFFEGAPAS